MLVGANHNKVRPQFFFFFSYILTTSYRVKNTPTWACFLFLAAVHTSLTPSYPATPNPTSPLLQTPKTRLCGHVFGVCRLSSVRWLPFPSPYADNKNTSTRTRFCCLQALLHLKSRNTPPWVCFCFLLAPLLSPPCQHQKHIHRDTF